MGSLCPNRLILRTICVDNGIRIVPADGGKMVTQRLRSVLLFFTLLLLTYGVYAAPPASRLIVPENYEVRARYRDLIFGPRIEVGDFKPVVEEQFGLDTSVSMQVMNQNGSFYLVFTNEDKGEYPLYSQGSYIIKRDLETGAFAQIKIFIRSEPGSFLRIHPAGRRSKMDVYLMDTLLYRGVVLPLSLEQIALESFTKIVSLSRFQIEWDLLTPVSQRPDDLITMSMITKLRDRISDFRDSDDGAMDVDGVFRFIEDLTENPEGGFNCSGFAKWVVDGLYQPITGELLSIEGLKEKHLDYRGNAWSEHHEDSRDPYFGLDWSRNLAIAMLSLGGDRPLNPEAADVKSVPFFDYFEDVGYRVRDLDLVLFLLARVEPGYFYLGSINRDFGTDPVLKQHVHIAAFFPYFDENGVFHTVVMERNNETSIDSLKNRYMSDHVHLVRLPVSEGYTPPFVEF